MTHVRSIAAAQTTPTRGDVAANVDQHASLVRAAAEERAQVLVFPELSLTGYELDLADELAFSLGDPRLAPFIALASSCSMSLIVGAPVRWESKLYIGAFVISRHGDIEVYTKHHLGAFSTNAAPDGIVPPAEATVFHAGSSNPLVRFGDTTAAVAVCADTGRSSHPSNAARRGAGVYLASMFVVPSELERETATLEGYARRHSMAVAMANYGGPSGGLVSGGGSAVWSDSGELLARLGPGGTGVVIATEGPDGWHATTRMLDVG